MEEDKNNGDEALKLTQDKNNCLFIPAVGDRILKSVAKSINTLIPERNGFNNMLRFSHFKLVEIENNEVSDIRIHGPQSLQYPYWVVHVNLHTDDIGTGVVRKKLLGPFKTELWEMADIIKIRNMLVSNLNLIFIYLFV